MQSKITELIKKFESLRRDLEQEYNRLMKEYGYSINKKRVVFLEDFRRRNRYLREGFFHMILNARTPIRHTLATPFIAVMIVPALILDAFLTMYQYTTFWFYRIPRVKREEYIVYERRFLDYLNWFQKMNCLYCSYVNGLFAYAVEIGARTERYWCPLKATHHPKSPHNWYNEFADYGNPEEWMKKYHDDERSFCRLEEVKKSDV